MTDRFGSRVVQALIARVPAIMKQQYEAANEEGKRKQKGKKTKGKSKQAETDTDVQTESDGVSVKEEAETEAHADADGEINMRQLISQLTTQFFGQGTLVCVCCVCLIICVFSSPLSLIFSLCVSSGWRSFAAPAEASFCVI